MLPGGEPPSARTDLPDGDVITLLLGGQRLQTWTAISITRGIEIMPPQAEMTLTTANPSGVTIEPFASCQVYAGQDLLITGYVQKLSCGLSSNTHQIGVAVGGKGQDLTECSAVLTDGTQLIQAADLKTIAEAICKPFAITVRQVGDDTVVVPQQVIQLGARPYDVLDESARFCSRILYENEAGELVISQVGTTKMASGLAEGINVEAASSAFDSSIRYSDYIAALMSADVLSEAGAGGNLQAAFKDTAVPRYRPLVSISPQANANGSLATATARWEEARRIGRSQAVRVTTSGWRDSAGQLWQINQLLDLTLPSVAISAETWLISQVMFTRDETGQHAQLTLMPPSAFTTAPSTVGAVGADLAEAVMQSNTPGSSPAQPAQQPRTVEQTSSGSSDGSTVRVDVNASDATSTTTTSAAPDGTRVTLPGLGPV